VEGVEHPVEGVLSLEAPQLGVDDAAFAEVDDAVALATDVDGPRLPADVEGLHQIDHAHVGEGSREAALRVLAPLQLLLLRLLENHPDAGDALFDVDRLGLVVLTAQLEPADLELHRLLVGEEDEGDATEALIGLERAAQLEAV